jgi:hypothetical protein
MKLSPASAAPFLDDCKITGVVRILCHSSNFESEDPFVPLAENDQDTDGWVKS